MAKEIVDAISMKRALMRMTYEIIERNKGTENLFLIGIKTRGLYLAQELLRTLRILKTLMFPLEQSMFLNIVMTCQKAKRKR